MGIELVVDRGTYHSTTTNTTTSSSAATTTTPFAHTHIRTCVPLAHALHTQAHANACTCEQSHASLATVSPRSQKLRGMLRCPCGAVALTHVACVHYTFRAHTCTIHDKKIHYYEGTKERAYDAAEEVMYAALERGLSFKLTMASPCFDL